MMQLIKPKKIVWQLSLSFAGTWWLAGCSHGYPFASALPAASQPRATCESGTAKPESSKQVVIGGWVPVFFTSLNASELDDIAAGIISQRIKRAVISYPTRMQDLATKIRDYLQQKTHTLIPMSSVELKDTAQVKYNLTQVIVTLYFN